jgi:hypothetical protein
MILACDPGLSGAFFWRGDVADMPTYAKDKRRCIDERGVFALVEDYRDAGAVRLVIEDVHGAPGQSAPAAFNFGYGVGIIIGAAIAAGLELERVAPQVWKRALKVPADKRASRARASELLPAFSHLWPLAKHDGRAEAAMLALYAERYLK